MSESRMTLEEFASFQYECGDDIAHSILHGYSGCPVEHEEFALLWDRAKEVLTQIEALLVEALPDQGDL